MISQIDIRGFGVYRKARLKFPPSGVVVVVGPNGAGKSTIFEAALWCITGKCLRASVGWKPVSDVTEVSLKTGNPKVSIVRGRSLNTSLADDGATISYQNVLLAKAFGDYKMITSTRIFHQAKASKFAHGGNSYRREILERVVDNGRFDSAFEQASKMRSDARRLVDVETSKVSRIRGRLDQIKSKLESVDSSVLAEKIEALKAKKKVLRRPWSIVDPPSDSLIQIVSDARSELAQIVRDRKRQKALANSGECPMCGSSEEHWVYRSVSVGDDDIRKAESKLRDLERELTGKRRRYERFKTESDANKRKLRAISEEISRLEGAKEQGDRDRSETIEAKRSAVADLEEARMSLLVAEERLSECSALVRIFGPSGARAKLLDRITSRLSGEATGVVRAVRGFGSIRVAVEGPSVVVSADFGHGLVPYQGLSVGEQRVVDFGILKALAVLPGTTNTGFPKVYDDILGESDEDVGAGIVRYIEKEAEREQVFVLVPRQELVELFSSPTVVRVGKGGKIG